MNNFVLKTLVDKRVQLLSEQNKMNETYKKKIAELNASINDLKGNGAVYPNDEHPDYIRQSIEEI